MPPTASASAIAEAAQALAAGKIVAFPTETVYGLGGNANDRSAVLRVFEAKARPAGHPLIVHAKDLAAAFTIAHANERARALAKRFWPGPLTLVLDLREDAPIVEEVTGRRNTVAVRVPSHPVAQALLAATGFSLAAPSANPHGRLSPTDASHVRTDLGQAVDLILDGGPTTIGLESTIVEIKDTAPPALLRAGGIAEEDLQKVVGALRHPAPEEEARAPGMLKRHYAPRTPLRLEAENSEPGEAFLGFGETGTKTAKDAHLTRNLSPGGDLTEAAANLFRMLRELDATQARKIAIAPIPRVGLGLAINDRLLRASTGFEGKD